MKLNVRAEKVADGEKRSVMKRYNRCFQKLVVDLCRYFLELPDALLKLRFPRPVFDAISNI